jgi:hypothetical protein
VQVVLGVQPPPSADASTTMMGVSGVPASWMPVAPLPPFPVVPPPALPAVPPPWPLVPF